MQPQVPLKTSLRLLDSAALLRAAPPPNLVAHFLHLSEAQGQPVTHAFAQQVVHHAYPTALSEKPLGARLGAPVPMPGLAHAPSLPVPWSRPTLEQWQQSERTRSTPPAAATPPRAKGFGILTGIGLAANAQMLHLAGAPMMLSAVLMGLAALLVLRGAVGRRKNPSSAAPKLAAYPRATLLLGELNRFSRVPGLTRILVTIWNSGVPYLKADEEALKALRASLGNVPGSHLTEADRQAHAALVAHFKALERTA